MQAYSDFRVNCYPQTVIDLVTCSSSARKDVSHIVSYIYMQTTYDVLHSTLQVQMACFVS